jgi:hypothetical protein
LIPGEVHDGSRAISCPAEKARGGEIILNTPARRAIFLAGLIGAVGLVVVMMIMTMVR